MKVFLRIFPWKMFITRRRLGTSHGLEMCRISEYQNISSYTHQKWNDHREFNRLWSRPCGSHQKVIRILGMWTPIQYTLWQFVTLKMAIFGSLIYPLKMVRFHSYVGLSEGKPPFSYGFPLVFLWIFPFSYGFWLGLNPAQPRNLGRAANVRWSDWAGLWLVVDLLG